MKRRTGDYISMVMMVLLFLTASCTKEEGESDGGKIPVSITFSGRSGTDTGTGGNMKEDGIRTLRIIVAESRIPENIAPGRIVYNHPCPVAEDGSAHVTFELLEGTYDFYVVANEIALDFPDITSMGLNLSDLEDWVLSKDPSWYVAPDAAGIPFSYVRKEVPVREAGTPLGTISLPRALSRICLSFVNETGADQSLAEVKVAGGKADQGYLFEKKWSQAASRFDDLVFGENGAWTVGADENTASVCSKQILYVYPGDNPELDKYVLTALWNGKLREVELVDEKGVLSGGKIPRNTQVNVMVTLKSDDKLELACTVENWKDGGSSDIEYDEAFSADMKKVSSNPIVGESDNDAYAVVYGYPDKDLTFELTVSNPKGATWTANVTNGLDFEVKKADGGWASGSIDGESVMLVVRPRRSFEVGKIRETELYLTLTQNMVNRGEQVINGSDVSSGLHPGTTTRIRIRQVSINDFNKLSNK